jgi:LmbE family N-acetylglucosaminyl deacetylase
VDPVDSGIPVGDLPRHEPVSVDLPVPDVALAIGAHPDDVEFGCGATLAKWADKGCRIHHLVLTDGSKGTWAPDDDAADLVARRRAEQERAATILGGGPVEFLDYPDGELEAGMAQRRQVCRVIREVRPSIVLGHDPWRRYRLHPDHRNAGWLTTDGVVAARDPKFFEGLGPAPHRPAALLLWEPDEPNHVEEASAFVDRKIEALLAHQSQHLSTMAVDDSLDERQRAAFAERVRRQAAAHGALAGVAGGEAFRLIDRL